MTTKLTKAVHRLSDCTIRDGGRPRRLVVTLYPQGFIGLRQERARHEETVSLEAMYWYAVKSRVAGERLARAKKKAN
jgi:hypothetical protein